MEADPANLSVPLTSHILRAQLDYPQLQHSSHQLLRLLEFAAQYSAHMSEGARESRAESSHRQFIHRMAAFLGDRMEEACIRN